MIDHRPSKPFLSDLYVRGPMIQESNRCRPISYSESHMHIPRIQDRLEPLLLPSTIEVIELPDREWSWVKTAHAYAMRFSLHLALISLFETIFFWHFISQSEDTALISLVNTYAQRVLEGCATMTGAQRIAVRDVFDLFINQTLVDANSAVALTNRNTFNGILIRNSWVYFGSLVALFASTTAVGLYNRFPINWRAILLENLTLVTLLGFYEWMFFSTVVLQYQATSIQELDSMVVDNIQLQC